MATFTRAQASAATLAASAAEKAQRRAEEAAARASTRPFKFRWVLRMGEQVKGLWTIESVLERHRTRARVCGTVSKVQIGNDRTVVRRVGRGASEARGAARGATPRRCARRRNSRPWTSVKCGSTFRVWKHNVSKVARVSPVYPIWETMDESSEEHARVTARASFGAKRLIFSVRRDSSRPRCQNSMRNPCNRVLSLGGRPRRPPSRTPNATPATQRGSCGNSTSPQGAHTARILLKHATTWGAPHTS